MIALYFLVFLGFSIFTAALPIHAATDLGWSSSVGLGVLFTALALALVATESLLLPALAHVRCRPACSARQGLRSSHSATC